MVPHYLAICPGNIEFHAQALIRKMKHPRFSPFTIHGILQMSVCAHIYVSRAFPNGNLILGVDVPFQHRCDCLYWSDFGNGFLIQVLCGF